jgi:hypothetical protein
METIRLSETMITTYKSTWCHYPEDYNPRFNSSENFKSHIINIYILLIKLWASYPILNTYPYINVTLCNELHVSMWHNIFIPRSVQTTWHVQCSLNTGFMYFKYCNYSARQVSRWCGQHFSFVFRRLRHWISSWGLAILLEALRDFPQLLQANTDNSVVNYATVLPSIYVPIHYTLIIPSLDPVWSKQLKAFLNKYGKY